MESLISMKYKKDDDETRFEQIDETMWVYNSSWCEIPTWANNFMYENEENVTIEWYPVNYLSEQASVTFSTIEYCEMFKAEMKAEMVFRKLIS